MHACMQPSIHPSIHPYIHTYITETHENTTNLIIHDHHIIKSSRALNLDKLAPTKIYSILILKVQNKSSSNTCFDNLFDDIHTDWGAIYMIQCLAMYNTYIRFFQYKLFKQCFVL